MTGAKVLPNQDRPDANDDDDDNLRKVSQRTSFVYMHAGIAAVGMVIVICLI